jgi:hypothetical protein
MMLGKGRYLHTRILSPVSVTLMTMDHLTDAQKEGMEMFFRRLRWVQGRHSA